MPCVPAPGECKPYVVHYVIEASWAQGTFIDDFIIVGRAKRTQELCDPLPQVKAAPFLSPPFDGIPVIDPGRTI
jgi:hypothetical protein